MHTRGHRWAPFTALLLVACGPPVRPPGAETCIAASTRACDCDAGSGVQRCGAAGNGWSSCDCAPAAICTPASRQACTCDGDRPGERTCTADGSGFGACACAGPSCEPDAVEACTCPGGASGERACVGGEAWTDCACAAACTTSELRPSGSLRVGDRTVSYVNGTATVTATHASARCLDHLRLELRTASGGCALTLDYGLVGDGVGGLRSVRLAVDSTCGGFSGTAFGLYESRPGHGPAWFEGTRSVADGGALACVEPARITLDSLSTVLEGPAGALSVAGVALRVDGRLASTFVPGACLATGSCLPGLRDDGTGWCVTGACAGGFHDGGDGRCVAAGTCAPGYHDGGEDTCVPEGECLAFFHDGGDGRCVEAGTCSPGFHDGGAGECGPVGTCSPGHHDGGDGTCVASGSCAAGFHDDGAGRCIADGTCASGYHDGGEGVCVPNGQCSPGFLLQGDACVRDPALCVQPFTTSAGSDRGVATGASVSLSATTGFAFPPLVHAWTLRRRPAGSGAVLVTPDQPNTSFVTDLAGLYVVDLRVTDATGCSATDSVTVTAAPRSSTALDVQLTWSASADLDLHFLGPGGAPFTSPGDVYYGNKAPDWGLNGTTAADGDRTNDPVLDVDATTGIGPENVSYDRPFPAIYKAYAAFFCSTTGGPDRVATMTVLVGGVPRATFQSPTMQRGDLWEAASITVATNGSIVVTGSSAPLTRLQPNDFCP